jgi:hypothetical protein
MSPSRTKSYVRELKTTAIESTLRRITFGSKGIGSLKTEQRDAGSPYGFTVAL